MNKEFYLLVPFGFVLACCDDASNQSEKNEMEQLSGRHQERVSVSGRPQKTGRRLVESGDFEDQDFFRRIENKSEADLATEDDYLEWLSKQGIGGIDKVVEILWKEGKGGEISESERIFAGALGRFYHEQEGAQLKEIIEKIAYPGVYRGELVTQFSSNLVEKSRNPDRSILDLLTNGSPEKVPALHYMRVITDSAKYGNPENVLLNIPDPNDGKIGTAVVAKMVPIMLRQTPESAVKFFTEMDHGPLRDASTFFIVKYATEQGNYEAARIWAENATDERIKVGALEYVAKQEQIHQGSSEPK